MAIWGRCRCAKLYRPSTSTAENGTGKTFKVITSSHLHHAGRLADKHDQAVSLRRRARLQGQAAMLQAQISEQAAREQVHHECTEERSGSEDQLAAALQPGQAHGQGRRVAVAGHWVPERALHALCTCALQWDPNITWPSLRELLLIIHQVLQHALPLPDMLVAVPPSWIQQAGHALGGLICMRPGCAAGVCARGQGPDQTGSCAAGGSHPRSRAAVGECAAHQARAVPPRMPRLHAPFTVVHALKVHTDCKAAAPL